MGAQRDELLQAARDGEHVPQLLVDFGQGRPMKLHCIFPFSRGPLAHGGDRNERVFASIHHLKGGTW